MPLTLFPGLQMLQRLHQKRGCFQLVVNQSINVGFFPVKKDKACTWGGLKNEMG